MLARSPRLSRPDVSLDRFEFEAEGLDLKTEDGLLQVAHGLEYSIDCEWRGGSIVVERIFQREPCRGLVRLIDLDERDDPFTSEICAAIRRHYAENPRLLRQEWEEACREAAE